jgi:AraC-like DNA-binding protein
VTGRDMPARRPTSSRSVGLAGRTRREHITVSARLVAGIVAAGRARGLEVEALLAAVGIDPACLGDPDARLPIEKEEALWTEMARLADDPFFGLHAQRSIPPGTIDVLDYAVRSSPTLRDAFKSLVRYNRLVHDAAEFELAESGAEARLTQRFRGDPRGASWQVADYSLGGLLTVCRELVGDDWAPLAVTLSHAAPPDPTPYREFFGVMPRFDGDVNELVVPRTLLDRPIAGADPLLHDVLRRHADALLARLPRSEDLVGEVRNLLARDLARGEPRIEAIARKLGVNVRTLQRRLAENGSSFQDVLDELRHDLALRLLDERRVAVAEVAYLLGYSEPSAFHRAFKRWTGTTPDRHRQDRRTGGD